MTYSPPVGYQIYHMISSLSGNGLAAELVSTGNVATTTIIRFDPSGNATLDSWSAPSIIQNYAGSQWLGWLAGSNELSSISAAPIELSTSSWYAPDGNGGNAAVQVESVAGFSPMGANQTAIASVLQKVENALALPNYAVCNNWLQGAGTHAGLAGSVQIQNVLQSNTFGHGTFYVNGTVDYTTAAFSGGREGDPPGYPIPGVPSSATFTVNDVGAFFNQFANGDPGKIFEEGRRKYSGNTLRAQATILIHETAHQITVNGFRDDFGKRKVGKENDKTVDINCRQLIEGIQ